MLVIVHHGNIKGTLQTFLNVKTLRSLNIFEVNTAEGWCNLLNSLAELLRILFCHLDVEHIDTTVNLEQQTFTLHNGFSAHRTNVAKTENGCTIGNDSDQIAFICIFISIVWVLLDFKTWIGHTWRIGQ